MFDFSIYKETRKYFNFYDVFLKEHKIRKDDIFKKLFINNSTYRRCRDSEQKIGREIITDLSNHFDFKLPSDELVDQLESLSEKVYNNMYYKVYNTYEEDLTHIDNLIQEKSLLVPILELLKLFMLVNSKKLPKVVLEENSELYRHIFRYRPFFTEELNKILDVLTLFFSDEMEDEVLGASHNNALSYQILAARSSVNHKYIEAIYFGNIAKNIFMEDMNIKRVIAINFTIMNNLLNLGNYDKCYEIAYKQLLSLTALKMFDYEYEKTYNLMIVSLFGKKEYNRIINEIINSEIIGTMKVICLFVSLYMTDMKTYIQKFEENKETESIFLLDRYLTTRDKKILLEFENLNILPVIIKILHNL